VASPGIDFDFSKMRREAFAFNVFEGGIGGGPANDFARPR
jgi:hypothetical protein